MAGKNAKIAFFLILFLVMPPSILAIDKYIVEYECFQGICLVGNNVKWTVNITNVGISDLKIDSLKVIDSVGKKTLAFAYYEFPLEVRSNEKKSVVMSALLPEANSNLTLNYSLCVITVPPTDLWGDIGRTVEYCYPEVYTITIMQCLSNDMCKDDEFCDPNKQCVEIKCPYCHYTSNHSCHAYGCCKGSECNFDEACINNTCLKLECNVSEVIINNSCSETACKEDEEVINETCKKLNCSYDEHIVYHKCVALDCPWNETFVNNSCYPFKCNRTQAYINNSCVKLNCPFEEGIFNNSCKKLNCFFLLRPYNNFCGPYWTRVLETALLIIIILLLFKDIRAYIYIKSKKTAAEIYERIQNKKINK